MSRLRRANCHNQRNEWEGKPAHARMCSGSDRGPMTTRDGDKRSSTGRNLVPPNFPTIEGYKFLQTIARSPKSEVYVAYSDELGHNVAIKVLRTGPLSGAESGEEERFERERMLLTRVKHPGHHRCVRLGTRRRLSLHRDRVLPKRQSRAAHSQFDDGPRLCGHLRAGLRRARRRTRSRAVSSRSQTRQHHDATRRTHRAHRLRARETHGRHALDECRRSARLALLHQPRTSRRRCRSINAAISTVSA